MNANDLIQQSSDLLEVSYKIKTAEATRDSLAESIRNAPVELPEIEKQWSEADRKLMRLTNEYNTLISVLTPYKN